MTITTHLHLTTTQMRPSPTMSAANMAKEAEATGRKVEVVTLGDLFPKPSEKETTEWLARLTQEAADPANHSNPIFTTLRDTKKRYAYSETAGLPSLRAAASFTFSRDTGLTVSATEICVGTGGKGALNGALFNSIQAGDVVILAAPGWPTNYDMFPADVTLVEVPTGDGILRAAALQQALAHYPNPALILINAPCNPTGANYTVAEREAFFAVVNNETRTTLVASDDPYGKLVYEDAPYDIRAVVQRGVEEKKLHELGRLATFRSVSKEYGLAGERVGFVATKNKTMLTSLQSWNESKGGGMGVGNQLLAQAALLYGDDFITRTVALLQQKRQALMDGVAKLKNASMRAPMGTIYGWVDFSDLKGKTVPAEHSHTGAAYRIDTPAIMNQYLVYVAGVCGVPGTPFYAPQSPAAALDWHVRISFCCEMEQLTRVITQLAAGEKILQDAAQNAA